MEKAYAQLRREILSVRLQPGSEISETDIADKMSMSKTPVREALARLQTEGFVRAYPRRGYQINPLTISDMNELFDARSVVEGGTVGLAVDRITDQQLDELERLADASYDKRTLSNLDLFIGANREFHMAIAGSTGNQRLIEVAKRQFDELERYFYVGAQSRDINTQTHADHHRIVTILRQRDPVAARKIIVDHNEETRRGLIEIIANGRNHTPLGLA
ncbi:GntR family transcriptional regulator [Mesorhizobium sp. M7D.F.Ca.US.004.03.1.1]|nr:GntR family transcriptional regulator [Mesorhizobium sp. M7D.F.Ca.US.004.03.1.1]